MIEKMIAMCIGGVLALLVVGMGRLVWRHTKIKIFLNDCFPHCPNKHSPVYLYGEDTFLFPWFRHGDTFMFTESIPNSDKQKPVALTKKQFLNCTVKLSE